MPGHRKSYENRQDPTQGKAGKTGVDTIEKAIYTLECKLNTPHKYTAEDRELMHQGIEWLKAQKLAGKKLIDVINDLPSDAKIGDYDKE